jgi:cyclohexa-1,5-dienecarbonyl-CoA hydratase
MHWNSNCPYHVQELADAAWPRGDQMAEQNFQSIQVSRQNSAYCIQLNRPPLNIIDLAMIQELQEALREAENDPNVQVIVIRGSGPRGFSAGVSVQDHTPDRVRTLIPHFDDLFLRLASTERITLAAVHGFCLGGGFELAAACDLVVAAETAQFGQPEIKLGQLAPIGLILLPHLIGYRRAAEIVLTGATFGAQDAEAWGLVNRVVPEAGLSEAVNEILGQLGLQSRAILRLTKSFLRRTSGLDFPALLKESEDFFFDSVLRAQDSKEGIYAFLEKRAPHWSHA